MKPAILYCLILIVLGYTSCRQSDNQLLHKAYLFSQQKKYTDAIATYTEAINRGNTLQLAYYNRGQCYLDINNYEKALADFDSVLSLLTNGTFVLNNNQTNVTNSSDVSINEALYQRGQVYYFMDSVNKAFHDFQQLIDNNFPGKCRCLLWQGAAWEKAGETAKACEYFAKAKQLAVSTNDNQQADTMLKIYCDTSRVVADSIKR
jgi:tetratricopeptide (TPR) repeat protein